MEFVWLIDWGAYKNLDQKLRAKIDLIKCDRLKNKIPTHIVIHQKDNQNHHLSLEEAIEESEEISL